MENTRNGGGRSHFNTISSSLLCTVYDVLPFDYFTSYPSYSSRLFYCDILKHFCCEYELFLTFCKLVIRFLCKWYWLIFLILQAASKELTYTDLTLIGTCLRPVRLKTSVRPQPSKCKILSRTTSKVSQFFFSMLKIVHKILKISLKFCKIKKKIRLLPIEKFK